MKKFLFFINNLAVVSLLLAYASPLVAPTKTWFFSIFGLGYPFILILNILFFLMWLAVKPRYALLSGLVLLLGFNALQKAIGFNPEDTAKGDLSIMTYNIGKTRIDFHHKGKEEKIKKFKTFIQKQQPEIICIQERLPRHLKFYKDIFTGYNLHPKSDIGTAIYSKYPIIKGGNIPFNTKSHNATWADIEVNKKRIRVYSIHLSSNRVTNLTDDIKEIFDESKYILSKYNEHAQIRMTQLQQVLDHAAKSPYPVIINGDFNDVPQSYIYRMIDEEYKDAFREGGQGLMQTFIGRFIGLRIDFSFLSEDLKVLNHDIIKTNLSDHYPLVTTVDL